MSFEDIENRVCQLVSYASTFERLVNLLGGPKDTPLLHQKLHDTRCLILYLLSDTTAKLQGASDKEQHTKASVKKKRKARLAKLTKDIQAAKKKVKATQLLADKMIVIAECASVGPRAVHPSRRDVLPLDGEIEELSFGEIEELGFGGVALVGTYLRPENSAFQMKVILVITGLSHTSAINLL
ncbi:syntaxin-23-like isoform X2 [Papaver somniferum]|uniref:syntaxin-23-like isoform X2 n=1 Tax=Papaver somniferum TaxID=3469 RepID=UPI000E70111B|nr:syntaxin-23-like isoform X2 [Papaver somniferum]